MDQLASAKQLHFIGIGGVGMAGLAEIALVRGFAVSGSDAGTSSLTKRLTELGATVYEGHMAAQLGAPDLVVISTAIPDDNVELVAAHAAGIRVLSRAQFLSMLMDSHDGIAIAGTHGKTTTTSLTASVFCQAQRDPTFVIGGSLKSVGSNAMVGQSNYFIAEADESDASFLYLNPKVAVVTNIEADHMSTYDDCFDKLTQTFIDFLHRLPVDGYAVLCLDDDTIRGILPKLKCKVITYGSHPQADYCVAEVKTRGQGSHFTVTRKKQNDIQEFILTMPGKHNVLNAAAALAVASEEGVSVEVVAEAFETFKGVGRRFNVYDDVKLGEKSITLVDDYAHHPSELEATITAANDVWQDRKLVAVFQPHRYSRTRDLFDDFVAVLQSPSIDTVILLDVYAAGEAIIVGADTDTLAQKIQSNGKPVVTTDLNGLSKALMGDIEDGSVVLAMGAGSIGRWVKDLLLERLS